MPKIVTEQFAEIVATIVVKSAYRIAGDSLNGIIDPVRCGQGRDQRSGQ
jgi:hypothetical protein